MATFRARKLAGAGGEWIVQDEREDPRVICQIGETHCCAACVAMILQDRNLVISQEKLAAAIGVPTPPDALPQLLNTLDVQFDWDYGYIAAGLDHLNRRAPWIALFKDVDNHLLHAVIVDGLEGKFLRIRDPSPPGTTYLMTPENFQTEHHGWTGLAVYTKRKKRGARRK